MSGHDARARWASRGRSIAVTAGLALAPALSADAQTCLGNAGFASHRVRIHTSVDRTSDATRALGWLMTGSGATFGGAAAGIRFHDRLNETSLQLAGLAGMQLVPLLAHVHACPIAMVSVGVGPRSIGGGDFNASSQSAAIGLSAGTDVWHVHQAGVVLTSALAVEWARVALEGGAERQVRSDTRALLSAGAGIVFAQRVSIVPRVTLPIGTSDRATRFSLSVGVGLGRRMERRHDG